MLKCMEEKTMDDFNGTLRLRTGGRGPTYYVYKKPQKDEKGEYFYRYFFRCETYNSFGDIISEKAEFDLKTSSEIRTGNLWYPKIVQSDTFPLGYYQTAPIEELENIG